MLSLPTMVDSSTMHHSTSFVRTYGLVTCSLQSHIHKYMEKLKLLTTQSSKGWGPDWIESEDSRWKNYTASSWPTTPHIYSWWAKCHSISPLGPRPSFPWRWACHYPKSKTTMSDITQRAFGQISITWKRPRIELESEWLHINDERPAILTPV